MKLTLKQLLVCLKADNTIAYYKVGCLSVKELLLLLHAYITYEVSGQTELEECQTELEETYEA